MIAIHGRVIRTKKKDLALVDAVLAINASLPSWVFFFLSTSTLAIICGIHYTLYRGFQVEAVQKIYVGIVSQMEMFTRVYDQDGCVVHSCCSACAVY